MIARLSAFTRFHNFCRSHRARCRSRITTDVPGTIPNLVRWALGEVPLKGEFLMRKILLGLIAFGAFAFAAAPALAGQVKLTGTHSREEIKRTCDANGGTYDSGPKSYMCVGPKGTVLCQNTGQCTGSCDACGKKASRFTFGGILWSATAQTVSPFQPGFTTDPQTAPLRRVRSS